MLPSLKMEKTLQDDFYIHEVFDEKVDGRMVDKYSIDKYFARTSWIVPITETFLFKAVDFWNNESFADWVFLGYSTLFFSFVGLVFSRDKRKHLFFWPIILIILLQCPRDPLALTSVAHWINVLTNPFAFLIRGPHMTALLMPFLFLPLVALGVHSVAGLIAFRELETIYFNRIRVGFVLFAALLVYFVFYVPRFVLLIPDFGKPWHIAIKCVLVSGLMLMIYYWIVWDNVRVNALSFLYRYKTVLVISGLAVFLFLDLSFLKIYINRNPWASPRIFAGIIDSIRNQDIVNPFYQNPTILPFREYYWPEDKELTIRRPSSRDLRGIYKRELVQWMHTEPGTPSWSKMNSRQAAYGLFYQFNHLGRFLFPPSKYHPRHKTYEGLEKDDETREYLKGDQRVMFLAANAVSAGSINPVIKGLIDARRVVSVEAEPSSLVYPLPMTSAESSQAESNLSEDGPAPGMLSFAFSITDGKRRFSGPGVEISFDLPDSFPSYISSSVFTRDQYSLKATIGDRIFKPAQGKLVRPFTFDVQNVHTEKLTVLVPEGFIVSDPEVRLSVRLPEGLLKVSRNEHDNFGFEYRAEMDGWLVIHYPYDKKWRLILDGNPVSLFRANGYFIAFPVSKGDHQILLQYWPDTWLREMIGVSVALTVLVFFGLVLWGIQRENLSVKLDSALEA